MTPDTPEAKFKVEKIYKEYFSFKSRKNKYWQAEPTLPLWPHVKLNRPFAAKWETFLVLPVSTKVYSCPSKNKNYNGGNIGNAQTNTWEECGNF